MLEKKWRTAEIRKLNSWQWEKHAKLHSDLPKDWERSSVGSGLAIEDLLIKTVCKSMTPVYVFDINQPSMPTPFYSVLVSVSVFMALSTIFHSINSPDNSAFWLCFSRLISALLVFSTTYLFMKDSFSPDIILCGWPNLKHQLTNYIFALISASAVPMEQRELSVRRCKYS